MIAIFTIAIIARLPFMSHGMDQYDVVAYKNSLVHMRFFREVQWPLLLLFQKSLWLIFYRLSPQQILSLTNIILAAATLSMLFWVTFKITKSYVLGLVLCIFLFFIPDFGVYSVVGMQDMAQTFVVMLYVAALTQYCLNKQSTNWLYITAAIAGLIAGVRVSMVLVGSPGTELEFAL